MVRIAKYAEKHAATIVRDKMGCAVLWCAPTVKYQNADMFGSDIVGKTENGVTYYVQVTTGGPQAVRVRKKKMEKIPWNEHDRVYLFVYDKGACSAFWPKVYKWARMVDASCTAKRQWVEAVEYRPGYTG